MTHYTYVVRNGVRYAETVCQLDRERPEVISGWIDGFPMGLYLARIPNNPKSIRNLEELLQSV